MSNTWKKVITIAILTTLTSCASIEAMHRSTTESKRPQKNKKIMSLAQILLTLTIASLVRPGRANWHEEWQNSHDVCSSKHSWCEKYGPTCEKIVKKINGKKFDFCKTICKEHTDPDSLGVYDECTLCQAGQEDQIDPIDRLTITQYYFAEKAQQTKRPIDKRNHISYLNLSKQTKRIPKGFCKNYLKQKRNYKIRR